MSTFLSFVQNLAQRKGLGSPTGAFGSTDTQILQIVGLLKQSCETLVARGTWEQSVQEAVWLTTASEDQGSVASRAPNGFTYILPNTLWDRSTRIPLYVPTTAQEWQALKAIGLTGPRYNVRIRRGRILSNPAPPAGLTWAFEYKSRFYATNAAGDTYKQATADDDQILLPDEVVNSDLEWRWLAAKGLDFAQAFEETQGLVADFLGREEYGRTIRMDGEGEGPEPKIFIPAGNFITP